MPAPATLFVKPAPGRVVRIPERNFRPLPATGETVPRTGYWLARQRDGDVIVVAPAPPPAPTGETTAPAPKVAPPPPPAPAK